VVVQPNQLPVIRTHQAHPVRSADREAAPIAGLPEAWAVPHLNRAITRKGATFNPVSNALSSDVCDHVSPGSPIGVSDQQAIRPKGYPMVPIGVSDDSPSERSSAEEGKR
jgi:hypothetical protein